MNRAFRFLGRCFEARRLIAGAMSRLILFRVGLLISPARLAKRWISDDSMRRSVNVGVDGPPVQEIIGVIRRCSGCVPRATCLTQALTARNMLGSYGYDAVLRIGVATPHGKFEAHAWVEVDGLVVIGELPYESRYAVLTAPRSVIV